MLIVDSQVHVWAADSPELPWPKPGAGRVAPHSDDPMTAAKLAGLMTEAGVDKAVLVPPSWQGERNDVVVAAARDYPGRFASMGRIDLDNPANRALLPTWRQAPGLLGIRLVLDSSAAWMREGSNHWLWAAAAEAGVPVTLYAAGFYPYIEDVLTRHKALKLCIDHMGCVGHTAGSVAFAHFPQLLALARYPNLAVKVSAAPGYSEQPYPFRDVHEPVKRVIDAFGPRRSFWGTDISRLSCTYAQVKTLFTEELGLREPDLEWIMGRGVCEWFGWK